MVDLTTLSYADLCDLECDLERQYGESKTQHDSEVALYGDAGSGQAITLNDLTDKLAAVMQERMERPEYKAAFEADMPEFDDIEF